MLFAVLTSFGKQSTISATLMLILLTVDYHQWLGLKWRKSFGRALATGIWYGTIYASAILLLSVSLVVVAYLTT